MRTSKFSDEEIDNFLRKIEEGSSIDDISKKAGVTIATIYNWKRNKKKNSKSIEIPDTIKELQEENLKLKQLIANLSLEKQDLIDLLKKKNILK